MIDLKYLLGSSRGIFNAAFMLLIVFYASSSYAVEGGTGFYLLGQRSNHAAVLPPPGLFFQFDQYLYSGDQSDSKVIAENGRLDLGVEADVALSMATGVWAPTTEILAGDRC